MMLITPLGKKICKTEQNQKAQKLTPKKMTRLKIDKRVVKNFLLILILDLLEDSRKQFSANGRLDVERLYQIGQQITTNMNNGNFCKF